jgi:hypothetical protein
MEIIKLLQSLEDLIYQAALWIILIPKTFVKVVRQPRWCQSYVAAELAKDPSRRFDEYMSPILFWITTAVVPYLLVIDYLRSVSQSRVAQETEFSQFIGFPWATRLLVVAMFASGGPLGFSVLIEKAKHTVVGRESLRRTFYTQCFCFAPATFFLIPFVWITLRFNDDIPGGSIGAVFTLSFWAFLCWLFYAEMILIKAELNVSWFKAVIRFIGYAFVSYCLTFFLELVVITLSQGLQTWK